MTATTPNTTMAKAETREIAAVVVLVVVPCKYVQNNITLTEWEVVPTI